MMGRSISKRSEDCPLNGLELRVKAQSLQGTRTGIKIRRFPQILVDTIPEFGGTDTGPCPTELMLASLAGCIVETAMYLAKRAHITLSNVDAETSANIIREGDRYALKNIETVLRVSVDSADLGLAKNCLALINKLCIVSNSMAECPPVSVSLDVTNTEKSS